MNPLILMLQNRDGEMWPFGKPDRLGIHHFWPTTLQIRRARFTQKGCIPSLHHITSRCSIPVLESASIIRACWVHTGVKPPDGLRGLHVRVHPPPLFLAPCILGLLTGCQKRSLYSCHSLPTASALATRTKLVLDPNEVSSDLC